VATNVEEGATIAEAILEVGQVVVDAVKGAKPLDKARGDFLFGGSCPELDSACHCALPHDGHQLSWEFRDSSHGEAYRRGSTMVMMGLARDRANRDTSVYPGSGPCQLEVNPYFLPASY
jgi:hypothetical protein